ncbi:unnamed protein product [Cylindrotheca closterium]|uniref:Helicase-associated domain-containing protein n=1 Tax=Cylindrotheca closterium TaxID=2856 RepID=A0AAD2G1B0_9STRA|nr:unnamed protein product [Cylindrotheca closterium]
MNKESDGVMLEPTPFRDGTTLTPSSHFQGLYTVVVGSARQSDVSQLVGLVPPWNQTWSNQQPNQNQSQQYSHDSMATAGHILIRNSFLDALNERDSTHASSSLLNSTPSKTEAPLAYQSKRKRARRDQQIVGPNNGLKRDPNNLRYRSYQQGQWDLQFQELLKFKEMHGHCHVPHTYDHNPILARWAKRQRYQYTMKLEQKQSCLSDDRQQKLDEVGFIWDLQMMAWQERFNELVEYKRKHGDCNVPNRFGENLALGQWVKSQRRQFKLYGLDPSSSRLTPERHQLLTSLGFTQYYYHQRLVGSPNKNVKGANPS